MLLSLAVMLWTAGFDVLYACQDYDFDRRSRLHSIPQRFGIARALWIARAIHALMFITLVIFLTLAHLSWLGLIGVALTGALLVYQHSIVRVCQRHVALERRFLYDECFRQRDSIRPRPSPAMFSCSADCLSRFLI